MNLYLVSQDVNGGYDTYGSFVVAAISEDQAKSYHPSRGLNWNGKYDYNSVWCSKEDTEVQLIGKASKDIEGIICS